MSRAGQKDEIANIKMRRVEHVYYKVRFHALLMLFLFPPNSAFKTVLICWQRPYKPSPVRRLVEPGESAVGMFTMDVDLIF